MLSSILEERRKMEIGKNVGPTFRLGDAWESGGGRMQRNNWWKEGRKKSTVFHGSVTTGPKLTQECNSSS